MSLRGLLDDALEISVVGSFSRIGYGARRRLFGWSEPDPHALDGRTVLVTGANSGLGRASVDAFAALGARTILAGRSEARLRAVRDELVAHHGVDRFPVLVADMASLESVRRAVAHVLDTEARLDALIDNAGAIFSERTESPDGIEATLATMVVGPFAMISGLLPLLRAAPDARVVSIASGGMYLERVDFADLQLRTTPYNGLRAYARSKRIQVALVREWDRRLPRTAIRFNAMHPGWSETPGVAESIPGFYGVMRPLLRTPAQGADTIVWLTADPDAGRPGGQLYLDRRTRPYDRLPSTRLDAIARRRLWDIVVELAGIPSPAP